MVLEVLHVDRYDEELGLRPGHLDDALSPFDGLMLSGRPMLVLN